jgi:hypothetical protein
MGLHRLAKDSNSAGAGGCPALYGTGDPTRMIAQGKSLTPAEASELIEVRDDETAVAIPTETVLRGVAKYATEHGDDDLAGQLDAFLADRGL